MSQKSVMGHESLWFRKPKESFYDNSFTVHSAAVGVCFDYSLWVYLVGTNVLWATTMCPMFSVFSHMNPTTALLLVVVILPDEEVKSQKDY